MLLFWLVDMNWIGLLLMCLNYVISLLLMMFQAGGPFYPLLTGRRDSMFSYSESASAELPSPQADLSETLASFASRGFDTRETVSLFGMVSLS